HICTLAGHSDSVISVCVSQSFSIAVSGSKDCTWNIWDLNRHQYIRSVREGSPVTVIAISPTIGDIAIFAKNTLSLYTINGQLISKREMQHKVTCMKFTNLVEGLYNNC